MALALAAVGSGSGEVPASYVLDALAQRWNVAPWELEAAPSAWIHRGVTFMRMESEARRG